MNKKIVDKMFRTNVLRQGPGGLVRMRGLSPLSRRAFSGGLLGGAAAAAMLPGRIARADTAVNFMGWQGYEEGFAAGGFLEANGYSLNNTYMNDNNQIIATATAGGMGNMDIATPDHGYTPVMAEIGILQELDLERLPNYGNLFDFFKNVPGPNVDGTQYALPYTWGSIPLMYNPEFVTEKPTSWRDIMKPEYKGRVALTNDVISVIIPFTMTATSTKTPTRITKDELSAAIDMLIDVKTNYARTIASGYGELADLFASGEVIMAQSWEPVAAWAGDKGVKLDWTVPQEGTWTLIDCLALITDSPNEDAAYALLNHGLSAEAQAHVANVNTTGVTAEPAVPLLNDRARSMYPYDDIPQFFADTGGGPFPLWPLDREGDYVTFDEVLDEWERFLKA
ncbi:MAG: extracellular solute-binding protein [Rhodospirillaceae bacterium]|nr:extracellular solute-binding protein [Rhodospirillaceae bacterium]